LVFRSSPVDGGGFIVDVSFHRSVGASHSPLPAIDATRRIVERHALIEVPLSDPKCRRESNGKTTLSPAAWRIALFASWAYGGRTDHHVSQSTQERDRLTRGCVKGVHGSADWQLRTHICLSPSSALVRAQGAAPVGTTTYGRGDFRENNANFTIQNDSVI